MGWRLGAGQDGGGFDDAAGAVVVGDEAVAHAEDAVGGGGDFGEAEMFRAELGLGEFDDMDLAVGHF